MQWLHDSLLTILIALPLAGIIALALIPKDNTTAVKRFAVIITGLVFVLSVVMFILYDETISGFQFAVNVPWISAWGASFHVAADGLSLLMVLLTTFIFPLAVLFNKGIPQASLKTFMTALLFLESGILGVFAARDMLLFYVFWEVMLIPLYFLIGIWGGEDRVRATVRFFIYTMAGSLLMLVAILYMYFQTGPVHNGLTMVSAHSFAIEAFEKTALPLKEQMWLFAAFTLAFLIKAPVFPFHTWQPLAYTQAPLAVTVLLAAVLAKTAVYGLMRFSIPFFPVAVYEWSPYLMGLSAFSVVFGAMTAWVQKTMKQLIAYASLSHMGMMALGVFAMTTQSWTGGTVQMIAHGITVAGIFIMIGFLHGRKATDDVAGFGGLWRLMPVFGALFLLLALSMIGLPGTGGFIGEFLLLIGTFASPFAASGIWAGVALLGIIFAAVYMLSAYRKIMLGPMNDGETSVFRDIGKREIALLVPLVILIFWIGFYPGTFIRKTEPSIRSVIIRSHQTIDEYQAKQKIKIKQPGKQPPLF